MRWSSCHTAAHQLKARIKLALQNTLSNCTAFFAEELIRLGIHCPMGIDQLRRKNIETGNKQLPFKQNESQKYKPTTFGIWRKKTRIWKLRHIWQYLSGLILKKQLYKLVFLDKKNNCYAIFIYSRAIL